MAGERVTMHSITIVTCIVSFRVSMWLYTEGKRPTLPPFYYYIILFLFLNSQILLEGI
jgi:hypothetical protein